MRRSLAAAVTTSALALAVGPTATTQAAALPLPVGTAATLLDGANKAAVERGLPVSLPEDGLVGAALPLLQKVG